MLLSDKKVHIHLSIINRHSVASCIHRGRLKQWAWLAALLITFPLLSFLPRPSTSPPTIYLDIPMYDNDSTKHRNSSRDSSVSSWVLTLASVYAGTLLISTTSSVHCCYLHLLHLPSLFPQESSFLAPLSVSHPLSTSTLAWSSWGVIPRLNIMTMTMTMTMNI